MSPENIIALIVLLIVAFFTVREFTK